MKLDKETVEKLAHLARLEFSEEEKEAMVGDMDKILAFVEKLSELDLKGVDPLVYLTEEENVLRKDEIKTEVSKADALRNAPDKDSDYFRVPKVMRGEE